MLVSAEAKVIVSLPAVVVIVTLEPAANVSVSVAASAKALESRLQVGSHLFSCKAPLSLGLILWGCFYIFL